MATLRKKTLNVARLKQSFEALSEDALEAAKEAGDLILQTALPLTPMDTGALRDSGRVTVEGTAKNITVKVTFGDDAEVPYAAIVHEDMERPQNYTTPGTGAKYLEIAVDQCSHEIEELFAQRVMESFRKMEDNS